MSNFKSIDIDNKEDLEFAKKIHSLKKKINYFVKNSMLS